MPYIRNTIFQVLFYCLLAFIFLNSGCASIQAPTGGPRDSVAPKIIKESPANFTVNFNSPEINIEFDEYFKLNNQFKEVSISPAVDRQPDIRIKKKVLNIRIQDTLAKNTTYTINFGNAIGDYNENNILKNYIYVFSTGSEIDSLTISGTVVNAVTKKPELDATVFILPLEQDTLFGKKRAPIFTSTDTAGNSTLRYLRENTYKIYAVKEGEGGGDKIYNSPDELVGFQAKPIKLSEDTTGIRLEVFKQEAETFRVSDRKIENTGRILYAFNKKLEKPGLKILTPNELDTKKIVEFSRTKDTAYVWTDQMTFDSIVVELSDNNKILDTTTIRRSKRDNYKQEITVADNSISGRIKPGTDLLLTFSAPVSNIDLRQVRLLQDSVPVSGLRVIRDSVSTRKFIFRYPWKVERQYILEFPENSVTGAFGGKNKAISKQYARDEEDNYGNLSLAVTVTDTTKNYVVDILNADQEVLQSNVIKNSTTVNYAMFSVGSYTIRVTYDENRNGKWDTGNVKERKQPEQVWNSPAEYTLRPNWDLEEKITIPPPQ